MTLSISLMDHYPQLLPLPQACGEAAPRTLRSLCCSKDDET